MIRAATSMPDHDTQRWVSLYRAALLELEHALMAGRIQDARDEIAARILKLHDIPGLHSEERQAIDDALSSLRVLERAEVKYMEDEQRKAAREALERLRKLEAAILRTARSSSKSA
jgi:hypothetical protein